VIILNHVGDFSEFWKKLKQPDLILIKPGPIGSTPSPSTPTVSGTRARDYVVNGVRIHGELVNDVANLGLEIDLSLLVPGEAWVPLGIDSPIIGSAREEDKELELRTAERGQWEVRLHGAGKHRLRLELKLPAHASLDKKHLAMAIPEALSTYFELLVPGPVQEAELADGGSIAMVALEGGKGTRLSAHLSPRSRLTLDWTEEAKAGSPPAPLLAAQVELVIDPNLDAVITRSSWVIRCVRGTARKLEIRLDELDVVTELKLENQIPAAVRERNLLMIPLGESMRPGETRRLSLQTRRTFPSKSQRVYAFSGFPLSNAAEQSGAIGITQSANLWINVATAEGLHRIDPRELPAELRARPGTGIAFQFLDHPYKLALDIESSPAFYHSESNTRIILDAQVAQVDTVLAVQRVHGRLFDIKILVPASLQVLSVGPAEIVESATPEPLGRPTKGSDPSQESVQILRIHLTPRGRDLKAFTLELLGQQRIGLEGEVSLGLFATRDGVSTASTVNLLADRDVTFEAQEAAHRDGSGAGVFHRQSQSESPAASPDSAQGERLPIAVFQSNQNPTLLRGRLSRHRLSVNNDINIIAHIDRHSIDVRQDTMLGIEHGPVGSLTVRVPLLRTETWQVQGKVTIRREELDQEANDSRRFRLVFSPPIVESSLLTFRFQVPLDMALAGGEPVKKTIPWIEVEESAPASIAVELAADPGIKTTVDDAAWISSADDERASVENGRRQQYRSIRPAATNSRFTFLAGLMEQVSLPSLVVPRALLRTVLGVDNESRTHAWYWLESHPATVSFKLPEHAQWISVRIDGRSALEVEHDPSSGFYKVSLPAESQSKPVLVEVEYQLSRTWTDQACEPPRLPPEAVVSQTLWEVQIPWRQALIGVPRGWEDENDWHWDFYFWKRRPLRPFSKLTEWVAGSPSLTSGLDASPGEDQISSHSYLFGRSGQPIPMSPWLANRAGIIAVCSGGVLVLGYLSMFYRSRYRTIWVVTAGLCLVGSAVMHPSVWLLVIQSALSGVILTLLGLLIHGLIERTGPRDDLALERQSPGMMHATSGDSRTDTGGVGSDESTAVRARVSSTVDYAPQPSVLQPEQEQVEISQMGGSV
jgi:hypothetical protein